MHNYGKKKSTETKTMLLFVLCLLFVVCLVFCFLSAQYGSLKLFARDEDTFQM